MTQIIGEEPFVDADAAKKGPYDQFILLGDSITQQSSSQELGFALQPALQDAFIRRLDIINRGFRYQQPSLLFTPSHTPLTPLASGYNTSQVLRLLTSFMPKPSEAHIRFVVFLPPCPPPTSLLPPNPSANPLTPSPQLIFLGANDACLPTSRSSPNPPLPRPFPLAETPTSTNQHVPLPLYAQNLRSILLHPSFHPSATSSTSSCKPPKLILCTPPPIDEYQQEDLNPEVQRTASTTKRYADACLEVGRAMHGVACLDLWGIMMKAAGWEGNREELVGSKMRERSEVLGDLLRDGLHFNPAAYKILFEATMDLIKENWPEEWPDNVAYVYPRWMFAPR